MHAGSPHLRGSAILRKAVLANVILFQLGWFACVQGGAVAAGGAWTLFAPPVNGDYLARTHAFVPGPPR